ncbi:MAG: hypothetical protein ABWY64_26515 [Tardiphaga sp.]
MSDKFCILAIDPGLSGALAFYYPTEGGVVRVYDMPRVENEVDAGELIRIIKKHEPTVAVIERVGPMPRDGVMQAWRFSGANSTAKVICSVMGIPTSLIPPAVWKKAMSVKGGAEGKEQCRLKALQLFPTCGDQFARKRDSGRAEAALLAYHTNQKFIFNREVQ